MLYLHSKKQKMNKKMAKREKKEEICVAVVFVYVDTVTISPLAVSNRLQLRVLSCRIGYIQ